MTPSAFAEGSGRAEGTWAEAAIEEACANAGSWFRSLAPFPRRVNLGSVVGFRHPAVVSEMDCAVNFSRILAEGGTPWSAMHHEVSVSRWLFDSPHPGATAGSPRWRVDLALMREEDLLAAELPATSPGFAFDAFVEFAYLTDSWRQDKATRWGEPEKGRKKVEADIAKIGRYVEAGVCRLGYAIVFIEADFGFPADFVERALGEHGCHVRFIASS